MDRVAWLPVSNGPISADDEHSGYHGALLIKSGPRRAHSQARLRGSRSGWLSSPSSAGAAWSRLDG